MMPAIIPWLAPMLIGGFAVVLGLALLLWQDLRRSERLSARLLKARSGGGTAEPEPGAGLSPLLRVVTAIGETIARSGALSTRTLEELRQTLQVAGFRGDHGLGLFVGTKILLVIGLPAVVVIAIWVTHFNVPHPSAVVAVAAGVGLLGSDKVVQHLRARYLSAFESGMPDALDMMVICGRARSGIWKSVSNGLVLRSATLTPVVADELTRTCSMKCVSIADTRVALLNLGKYWTGAGARRLS